MLKLFKRKSDKADTSSNSRIIADDEFIPIATRAQIYANELTNAINVNEIDERIIIHVTPTVSMVKFDKENKTYVRVYNGIWKEL